MSGRRGRIGALRQVIVFQFKLALDALRDLLISPLSLGAALLDFLFPNGPRWFYRVLALGRRSEEVIGLWRRPDDGPEEPDEIAERLRQLEDWMRREASSPQNREALRAWAQRMGNRLNLSRERNAEGSEEADPAPPPDRLPPPG